MEKLCNFTYRENSFKSMQRVGYKLVRIIGFHHWNTDAFRDELTKPLLKPASGVKAPALLTVCEPLGVAARIL